MPDFVNGPELTGRLRAVLHDAREARLAVAFWGRGAADALGIEKGTGVRLRIVCNLLSGSTNPAEIRTLRSLGAEVRQLNDLHAKLGVIDDLSFLGSSNMSTNGLGEEGVGANWREANVVYDKARPEISRMFDDFWKRAEEISEADLDVAAAAWALRRRGNAVVAARQGNRSLVEVLRTAPMLLDALNVRMVVHEIENDDVEREILDNADRNARQRYGDAFRVYWDWDIMRAEAATAYLVDYDWLADGGIADGALYQRDAENFPDFEENEESFHLAHEIKAIEGITFDESDEDAIRRAFYAYVQDDNAGEDGDYRTYNFLISELAPYLPPIA